MDSVTLRVTGGEAPAFWAAGLTRQDAGHIGIVARGGRLPLDLEDADGTLPALIDDGGEGPRGVVSSHRCPPPFGFSA